ncbi:MAG: hypothetical protein H7096_05630 [Flavobacterium sp.]|nr:hypothetical protein [Pedobacter sp.]
MKKQNLASEKLIEKFDNQLRDILAAELRSVRYAKTKIMNHLGIHKHAHAV